MTINTNTMVVDTSDVSQTIRDFFFIRAARLSGNSYNNSGDMGTPLVKKCVREERSNECKTKNLPDYRGCRRR